MVSVLIESYSVFNLAPNKVSNTYVCTYISYTGSGGAASRWWHQHQINYLVMRFSLQPKWPPMPSSSDLITTEVHKAYISVFGIDNTTMAPPYGVVVVLDQISIQFQIDRYVTVQKNVKIVVHHWWCLHQHQHRVHHRTQHIMPVRKRGHGSFCDVINAICKCSSGWLLICAITDKNVIEEVW